MSRKSIELVSLIKVLLGLDNEWKHQFDKGTKEGIRKIEEDYAKRNLFNSGMCKRDIGYYEIVRSQERKDEFRKRLLEGLSIIPSWLALLMSVIAILISIFG